MNYEEKLKLMRYGTIFLLLCTSLIFSVTAATQRPSAADTPGETLRAARTLYIRPGRAVDAKYLQYKLLRTETLSEWNISIVEDARAADLILAVEQVRLNYIFRLADRRTSTILVSGKVVAINDLVAADFLGKEIIKQMRDMRRLR